MNKINKKCCPKKKTIGDDGKNLPYEVKVVKCRCNASK
jgi:hypothetical protein